MVSASLSGHLKAIFKDFNRRFDEFLRTQWAMPIIVATVMVLIALNELGYREATAAFKRYEYLRTQRAELHLLLRDVLDAETGQRGYLLTGRNEYLGPYQNALISIGKRIQVLSKSIPGNTARRLDFEAMTREIAAKEAEMALTISLQKNNKDYAWKMLMETDQGMGHMSSIRTMAAGLDNGLAGDMNAAEVEILRTMTGSRIAIAVSATLGLIAVGLYWRQRDRLAATETQISQAIKEERDRLELIVEDRTRTLSELAAYLQSIREDERARLARELHDELGALFTAAKIDIARLKQRLPSATPEITERLDHLTQSLNSGIALKRRIIEDLRPSALSTLGLEAALANLIRDSSQRAGIPISANIEPLTLSDDLEIILFRTTQEALTNVFKHAGARSVEVTLHGYAHHVELAIRDDGVGFDVNVKRPASHGIAGMRHRLQSAGGRLEILSAAGKGTAVVASLPHRNAVTPASGS